MAKLLLMNGPNLNLLGIREPRIYGHDTLADIESRVKSRAHAAGHDVEAFQSNAEHGLIERIHRAKSEGVAFIIFNPGGLTHTSVALRDALLAVEIPFVEVHLSNVHARENFRHHSFLSDIARGVISGLGPRGYEFALDYAIDSLAR